MNILNFFKKDGKTLGQKQGESCSDAKKMLEQLQNVFIKMWILSCLNHRDMTESEILHILREKSGAAFKIPHPFGAIYALTDRNYIKESTGNTTPTYFTITNTGIAYLLELRQNYKLFVKTSDAILQSVAKENL